MEKFTSVNFLHISAIRKDEQSKDKSKLKLHCLVCTTGDANFGKPRQVLHNVLNSQAVIRALEKILSRFCIYVVSTFSKTQETTQC